jgi:hypothetical protein
MRITVLLEGIEVFNIDTKAVNQDSFPDLMRQMANVLYGKWAAETPQVDHKLNVKQQP